MAYFPSESRPDDVVFDENDGDEALTDSRFAVGPLELPLYSDAHNLRVWSSNGNDARMVLPTSSTKSRRPSARKRTVDGKRGLFVVAQFDSTLASAVKFFIPDVIARKDPSPSKSYPSAHHDDHEPNDPVHADEQRHHGSLGTSQRGHFEGLMYCATDNHEINSKANEVNDSHVVHDEKQDTTSQETGQIPPDVNRPSIVDKSLSISPGDFSSERSPKEARRDSTMELSSRSRTRARLPAFIVNDDHLMRALQTDSPHRARREVVIELVYRVLSCHHLRKYWSWPKIDQNMDRTPRIPTCPFQYSTSSWRRRSFMPLLGVENAWETELQQSLNLGALQSNESARPVSTRGDLSPTDASTPMTSEGTTSTASSAQSTPSKRPHRRSGQGKSNRGDNDNPSDNDEEDHPSKRVRGSSESSFPTEKLLACPYWKYDPTRYSPANTLEKKYRGCSSVYLRDIARLKQHLYRVHKMPDYHCQRCLEIFEDEPSLEEHVRTPVELACAYQENISSELLSERQCAQLRKRWTGKTTEEAWKCIWSIIFPRLEPPSSIYAEETPASVQPAQMPGFLSEFQRLAPSVLHQILIERSSEAESAEMRSWLQSIDAQAILNAAIEELFTRIPCSENSQPTPQTQPITTTTYLLPELPDFSDLLNFDIFDEAPTDSNPGPSEASTGDSDGPLTEKSESIESVLNRTHPVDDSFLLPKPADTPVKIHLPVKTQTPIKISGPIDRAIQRDRSPPRNEKGQIFCDHIDCRDKTVQIFARVCEWNRHMDRHEKPYKCQEPGCESRIGFSYSGGLLRHQSEIHKMHLPQTVFCPYPDCNRSSGTGFTRRQNLEEHIRRRHSERRSESSSSTAGALRSADVYRGSENTCDPRQLVTNVPAAPVAGYFINPEGTGIIITNLPDLGVDPPDSQETPVWHPR
ncbi:hypothetical protein PV04_04294 [Phialophora macrospora]|uniref:C2H2-type domain-containing protein n=1 Tax=Phialophora macrospora TaxID=1851006 RepID=A0A0D2CT33_9EURO|nr:hypothetical protein PV04_04294 [Phialophora macrospora]